MERVEMEEGEERLLGGFWKVCGAEDSSAVPTHMMMQ
jgi:hypothetical protein